jgi:hypothetical protein
MLDWWTVPGGSVGISNLDFKVEIYRKDSASHGDHPEFCTEADLALYRMGAWCHVFVRVIPVDMELTDYPHCMAQGEEVWGEMAEGVRSDRLEIMPTVASLACTAALTLRRCGFPVAFDPGSEFANFFAGFRDLAA